MVRAPYLDKNGIRKGAWSREEDEKLRAYIRKYGHWNWRELPKFAGLSRCGKSCRLRWMNYLRPDVKHGSYSKEEEDLILNLHERFGNKWSVIAAKLPGRTDNEIKNYWHTHLKKKSSKNRNHQATSGLEPQSNHKTSVLTEHDESEAHGVAFYAPSNPILESSPFTPETSCSTDFSNFSCGFDATSTDGISNWINNFVDSVTSFEVLHDSSEVFWTQPFVAEKDLYNQGGYSMSSLDKESLLHYASTCDDSTDLFYQVMQELSTI